MRNIVFCMLIFTLAVTSLFFCCEFKSKNISMASELEIQSETQTDVSIFIRKPTYSVFYNNRIYFLDDVDKLLKSYNTLTHSFDSAYLDLCDYKIIDASFSRNYLYVLVEGETENSVLKISLDSMSIISDFAVTVEKIYTSFFVQKITFNTKDYTLLTYSVCGSNSKVSVVDDSDYSVESFEIKFDEQNTDHDEIKSGLIETISYQDSNNIVYIIFVYAKKIAYFSVSSYEDLTALSLSSSVIQAITGANIPNDNADLNELIVKGVTFAKMDGTDYLSISFSNENSEQHIRLYSFKFGGPTDTLNYTTSFPCKNAKYMLFNEDYFAYVDERAQKLFFTKISIDESGDDTIYTQETIEVDNPAYEISYFTKEEFVYKDTNALTELFADPWGANSVIKIGKNTDVIKIGEAKILKESRNAGTDNLIKDYDYCLFTTNNRNYSGFVKTSHLKEKDKLSPKEAGYKEINGKCIVTVWPKTSLYSLPSTIAGVIGKDGSTLTSQRLTTIEDSSPVQVIDVLCNYFANDVKMIKVIVNDSQIGYIDANCVRNPSDIRDFIITNATIKKDNTTVYLAPSVDSTALSFKLEAGKNVRINGKRDTKTGFTSITFNDEFGNEYSGYIETDFVKSDSWSTLQIVGCVLIAINIGLLILILIYRKKHLGNRGQKIEKQS